MRKKKPGPRPGNKTKFQTSITFDLELKPILETLPNTSEFVNAATWREVKRRKPAPTQAPQGLPPAGLLTEKEKKQLWTWHDIHCGPIQTCDCHIGPILKRVAAERERGGEG